MTLFETILWSIVSGVGSGLGVYVGIRVDVAVLKLRATEAQEEAKRANVRIDDHIDRHHTVPR